MSGKRNLWKSSVPKRERSMMGKPQHAHPSAESEGRSIISAFFIEQRKCQPQKRQLYQFPRNAVKIRRLSDGLETVSAEGFPSRQIPTIQLSPLKCIRTWASPRKGNGATTKSESEDSDTDQDRFPHLCAYERKRLKNIKENRQFFAALNLNETAASLRRITTDHPRRITRWMPLTCAEDKEEQFKTSFSFSAYLEVPLQKLSMKPPGPLQMIPSNHEEENMTQEFLCTWRAASQDQAYSNKQVVSSDFQRYAGDLKRMRLQQGSVTKVVKNRIFSLAFHPSENRTLVAAGDKWGQVGVWDVGQSNVFMFELHSQPVGSLSFSPMNTAHLLSLSYDGTIRCGDVTRAIFDEVYRTQEASLSSFDFLSEDGSTLIVGHWDANVVVVDRRTPGTSHELWGQIASKSVRTVHVHPVLRHYILTAGAGSVSVYDVRHLKPRGNKPVSSLNGHTKSVASAYFSPTTGNRVVTTCADDRLRVYDTSCLSSSSILTTLQHNNNTGRWLTRFQAKWDPKQEDCFVVGSMARPRRIEVFHESGQLVHAFCEEEYLCSVCSINAMHPTRPIVAGGNSSGRVHVFMN
ncbi:LOW QUALITY PROTEIN: WD repeat-containing protein 76 [Microcaecilia unicolor]|uniref:WD repeat-containing protein 76 n=1 Tax=Microcaecilia unicolor TaxID=1415580 RepID=A0A6P7X613_9AMPH|nr:LOW QUALITY PROTEIN: WD repeat-containing protein 76 [Microcaecilia unicolor]